MPDDIDDAVAWAMVDLVDYWVTLKSSIVEDQPERTFWQACKRATWMATSFICQEWDDRPVALEALTMGGDESLPGLLPPQMSAEDIAIRNLT